jgi:phosphoribosylamine--glycine ligase/phosphoribosylformylglycinamidine cyclo-ligase
MIKILLLGNGGREHALAWKLSHSTLVQHIFVCPGNGGTALLPKTVNVDSIPSTDFHALVAFAVKEKVSAITSLHISLI